MTQNTKSRQNTSEKKVKKGDFGYFQSEKKRKLIITAILFAVPLFIFFTSWIYFKTRMTIWTVVTVVGCLPACKSLVGLIMILIRIVLADEAGAFRMEKETPEEILRRWAGAET